MAARPAGSLHQKHHADWFFAPPDEMGTVSPPALVYTAGRGDAGKRTSSLRRGYTPDQKRSVLLTAPHQVEPVASRVGCASPWPKAPVSPVSFALLEPRRGGLCKSYIRSVVGLMSIRHSSRPVCAGWTQMGR